MDRNSYEWWTLTSFSFAIGSYFTTNALNSTRTTATTTTDSWYIEATKMFTASTFFVCTIFSETLTSEKKIKSQDLGLSLCWITKAKTKENLWVFIFICKCGQLLWLVRAQHVKETLGGIDLPFHCESESENKSPIFMCNRSCADGN